MREQRCACADAENHPGRFPSRKRLEVTPCIAGQRPEPRVLRRRMHLWSLGDGRLNRRSGRERSEIAGDDVGECVADERRRKILSWLLSACEGRESKHY